ncbi:MAG: Cd(II)/Pb(II)-responsive transcriptional regulator [Georgfuchsia sp.]
MKIGELARQTGCPVETIRFYERDGLLHAPARSEGNYRMYDKAQVERLSLIRRCRSLDMPLDEIRALLRFRDAPDENCEAVNALLDAHIGHVAMRVRELKRLEKQLREVRQLCEESRQVRDCGILNELSQEHSEESDGNIPTGHSGTHCMTHTER